MLAVLPLVAWVLLAAFCVLGFGRKQSRFACWTAAAGMLLGIVMAGILGRFVIAPVEKKAGQTVQLTVCVESASSSYQDGMCRGLLLVEEENGSPVYYRVYGTAFPESELGERFSAQFSLEGLDGEEYRLADYADGAYLQAEIQGDYQPLAPSRAARFAFARLGRKMAQNLLAQLRQPYSGLLAAMTLGQTGYLSAEAKSVFRRAGISHLLVVSGLHLTLTAGVFLSKGKKRYFRAGALAAALTALFMMELAGMTPSVVRAGTAMLVSVAGTFVFAAPDPLTSLGLAGLLLCLGNPYGVCDLSFQLSFCACLGLVACQKVTTRAKRKHSGAVWLLSLLLPPVFAALFTLPVQLLQGLTVSGVSVIANLATVWLTAPALSFGLLGCLVGLLPRCRVAAGFLLVPAGLCVRLMLALATWAAELPFAVLVLPRWETLGVFVLCAFLAGTCLHKKKGRLLWVLLPIVIAVSAGGIWRLNRDVVRVQLVGPTNNPCAVVTENGTSLVLFRGGSIQQNRTMEYLENCGISEAELVVDLRQNGEALCLAARQVVTAEQLAQGVSESFFWNGHEVLVLNQKQGNLALLMVDGKRILMTAGRVEFSSRFDADLLLVPTGTIPKELQVRQILCGRQRPELEDGKVEFHWGKRAAALLRPGKEIKFKETAQ